MTAGVECSPRCPGRSLIKYRDILGDEHVTKWYFKVEPRHLRHSRFVALREDKNSADVRPALPALHAAALGAGRARAKRGVCGSRLELPSRTKAGRRANGKNRLVLGRSVERSTFGMYEARCKARHPA